MEDTTNEDFKYSLAATGQFKKDYKKYLKNSDKLEKIDHTIRLLRVGGVTNLPKEMKAHFLKGNYKGHLECHIEPDLLIIWLQYDEDEKEIVLVRLGSHSELFSK